MKSIRTFWIIVTVIIGFSTNAMAQKIKFMEGNKAALAAIDAIAIVYEYDNMAVGKYEKESDFIDKKKTDYNNKEAGKGNKWEKEWKGDRKERYQPQFEELFAKHSKVKISNTAPYKMIVKTFFTEPGYNIHISRKNASISGEVWILDNTGKVIAKLSFVNAPGRSFGGYDYDTGFRIQEAYAALGKSLAKYFK